MAEEQETPGQGHELPVEPEQKKTIKVTRSHIQGFIAGVVIAAIVATGLFLGYRGSDFFSGSVRYEDLSSLQKRIYSDAGRDKLSEFVLSGVVYAWDLGHHYGSTSYRTDDQVYAQLLEQIEGFRRRPLRNEIENQRVYEILTRYLPTDMRPPPIATPPKRAE